MVQSIPQQDLWGDTGRALGTGLSEQLPREYERERLSSGLQRLKNMDPNANPIDMLSQLYSIPGMRPDIASSLYPLMMQQAQFSALQNSMGNQGEAAGDMDTPGSIGAGGFTPGRAPSQMTSQNSEPGFGTSSPSMERGRSSPNAFEKRFDFDPASANTTEDIQRLQSERPVWSTEEKYRRALELNNSQRLRFPSIDRAMEEIDRQEANIQNRFDTQIATAQRRVDLQEKGEQTFDRILPEMLQKGGLEGSWSDIPAEYQTRMRNKVVERIKKGIPPDKAAKEVATEALSFAKSRGKLLSAKTSMFSPDKVSYTEQLRGVRDAYEREGLLELYQQDLQNAQGLSPYLSSEMAFPISPDVKKEINKLPSGPKVRSYENTRHGQGNFAVIPNIMDIANKITPKDSIKSIQRYLSERGYSDLQFFDTIESLFKKGDISLNDRQIRELEDRRNASSNLGDWWFNLVDKPKVKGYS